ncbi:hypothetical protein ACI782_18755 [Geodermatophilus sp. SYSU D00703]
MLDYLVVGGLLTVIAFCLFILTRIQPEQPARQQHRSPGDGGTTLMPAQVAPSPAVAPRPAAARPAVPRSHRVSAQH